MISKSFFEKAFSIIATIKFNIIFLMRDIIITYSTLKKQMGEYN